eukprot:gene7281-397_t
MSKYENNTLREHEFRLIRQGPKTRDAIQISRAVAAHFHKAWSAQETALQTTVPSRPATPGLPAPFSDWSSDLGNRHEPMHALPSLALRSRLPKSFWRWLTGPEAYNASVWRQSWPCRTLEHASGLPWFIFGYGGFESNATTLWLPGPPNCSLSARLWGHAPMLGPNLMQSTRGTDPGGKQERCGLKEDKQQQRSTSLHSTSSSRTADNACLFEVLEGGVLELVHLTLVLHSATTPGPLEVPSTVVPSWLRIWPGYKTSNVETYGTSPTQTTTNPTDDRSTQTPAAPDRRPNTTDPRPPTADPRPPRTATTGGPTATLTADRRPRPTDRRQKTANPEGDPPMTSERRPTTTTDDANRDHNRTPTDNRRPGPPGPPNRPRTDRRRTADRRPTDDTDRRRNPDDRKRKTSKEGALAPKLVLEVVTLVIHPQEFLYLRDSAFVLLDLANAKRMGSKWLPCVGGFEATSFVASLVEDQRLELTELEGLGFSGGFITLVPSSPVAPFHGRQNACCYPAMLYALPASDLEAFFLPSTSDLKP